MSPPGYLGMPGILSRLVAQAGTELVYTDNVPEHLSPLSAHEMRRDATARP